MTPREFPAAGRAALHGFKDRAIGLLLAAAAICAAGGPPAGAAEIQPWPPTELAERLQAPPKTDVDKTIKQLIGDYAGRIAALDANSPLVKANLPRLRRNLLVLYREYNQDKARYRADFFSPATCIERLKMDMKNLLDEGLEKGRDPSANAVGRWNGKTCWVEGTNIMAKYSVTVGPAYDPAKPSPVIIAYQSGPDINLLRKAAPTYLHVRGISKGYPKGLVAVENKTRAMLKDVAADFNVDPFRIYATGFSYGGRTDLILAWRHPHWFAAIAPVCSDLRGEQAPYVRQLKNVPALLLHGTGDSFLSTGKVVHQYMKAAGCPVEFQTYPGGHSADLPFRKDVTMLTKFFDKHVMDPQPRTVSHIVEHKRYSRAFWVNARLARDAGGAEGIFEVRVKDGNRIEIDANEQIAALELDLNEKLVDMKKPLVVVAGDKTLFEGKPAAKVTIKLRDGADYDAGEGDRLWRELLEIKKNAVYAVPRR